MVRNVLVQGTRWSQEGQGQASSQGPLLVSGDFSLCMAIPCCVYCGVSGPAAAWPQPPCGHVAVDRRTRGWRSKRHSLVLAWSGCSVKLGDLCLGEESWPAQQPEDRHLLKIDQRAMATWMLGGREQGSDIYRGPAMVLLRSVPCLRRTAASSLAAGV